MKSFIVPSNVDNISFSQYLNHVVWPISYWRNSGSDILQVAMALRTKLHNSVAGDSIELTDKEFEELSKKIGMPEMSLMPIDLTNASWVFSYAVVSAKTMAGTV